MRFLARDSVAAKQSFPLEPLIEEAYDEAKKHHPVRAARLTYVNGAQPVIVAGDRTALKHAFTEVLINALQANSADAKIGVRTYSTLNGQSEGNFARRTGQRPGLCSRCGRTSARPVLYTRNVAWIRAHRSRKIIETHQGPSRSGIRPIAIRGLIRNSFRSRHQ